MTTEYFIYQRDLLAVLGDFDDERGFSDWPEQLTPVLDPEGVMVTRLQMLHNDGPDVRILALAKMVGRGGPVTVVFTLPARHTHIIRQADIDDDTERE